MSNEYEQILGQQNEGEPPPPPEPPKEDPAPPTPPEPPKPADGEGEGSEPPAEKPHKSGSARAREQRDREREARIAAERERDELKARLNAPPPQPDPNEPKMDDFETLDAWRVALAEHHKAKAIAEAEARFKADQQARERQAVQARVKAADAKFAAEHPDFDDAMDEAREVIDTFNEQNAPGYPALNVAITESEASSALKYHLGKNPDELRRLSAMTPIKAVQALALLEAKLTAAPPPKPRTTNAPPPVNPLTGTSAVTPPVHRMDTYVEIQ